MHESTQVTEDLRDALEAALAAGTSREEIQEMLQTIPQLTLTEPPYPDVVQVYHDDLPEGLIDVPSAAKKYGRSRQAIYSWIASGLLPVVGFLAHGHVPSKVLREDDVAALVTGSRPGDTPVYAELPPDSIEAKVASEKYGVSLSTISKWVKAGDVTLTGKLRKPDVPNTWLAIINEPEFIARMGRMRKSTKK